MTDPYDDENVTRYTIAELFHVMGYYDDQHDDYYCYDHRPANWRELLALFPPDIPGVDESDDPPLCAVCGHYL